MVYLPRRLLIERCVHAARAERRAPSPPNANNVHLRGTSTPEAAVDRILPLHAASCRAAELQTAPYGAKEVPEPAVRIAADLFQQRTFPLQIILHRRFDLRRVIIGL